MQTATSMVAVAKSSQVFVRHLLGLVMGLLVHGLNLLNMMEHQIYRITRRLAILLSLVSMASEPFRQEVRMIKVGYSLALSKDSDLG